MMLSKISNRTTAPTSLCKTFLESQMRLVLCGMVHSTVTISSVLKVKALALNPAFGPLNA
jgi:hypothetical protein